MLGRLPCAALLLGLLLIPARVFAQGDRQDSGLSREQMWRAPTAEDWKKPCLIEWQRTWQDAERLSRATGRPILACVNMDGEIASEHYAGIRYRQPEVAELFAPYVCVIASVYRHSPRDYDAAGNRIPCPRFGTVTCGEHIAIEPLLYERYFDGERVAPRHVMIELDGSETYDIYYAFDTASVFETVRKGIEGRSFPPRALDDVARTPEELVASPDARDRAAVEEAYRTGSFEERRRILEAAVAAGDKASVDLLRLAIFGFDVDLARVARRGLARATDPAAVGLLNDALSVPMPRSEREELIAALDRLGAGVPWARTLAIVHRGLGAGSRSVDPSTWSADDGEGAVPPPDREQLAAQLAYLDAVQDSKRLDPGKALELAEAGLRMAEDPEAQRGFGKDPKTRRAYRELLLEDARSALRGAREAGAAPWRADVLEVLLANAEGDWDRAFELSTRVVGEIPPKEAGRDALVVLSIFASGRRAAIRRAQAAGESWPPEWLSDVASAWEVLERNPALSPEEVAEQVDFLLSLGAYGPARQVLNRGVERFPLSAPLHARLVSQVLAAVGGEGLEPTYDRLLAREEAPAGLEWYAGYASLVAAEFHRRGGEWEAAAACYAHGIAHFESCLRAGAAERDGVDHYVAMALAGQARVAFDRGDLDGALERLEASFARRAASAASLDGLNLSAVATARQLASEARSRGRVDLAEAVERDLAALDPDLLLPPAFEGGGPPLPGRGRR
ncbi:MAG TPA: hypothetical protein ENJ09_01450 [Planctomycetes bacterium]|nr:hypothetical protein [Planctomycetota bacterium]